MVKLVALIFAILACAEAERDTWVWPEDQPELGCVSLDDDVFNPPSSCNGNYGSSKSNPCTSQQNSYCVSNKCVNRCGCNKQKNPTCNTPCKTWNYPQCSGYKAGSTWGKCVKSSAVGEEAVAEQ